MYCTDRAVQKESRRVFIILTASDSDVDRLSNIICSHIRTGVASYGAGQLVNIWWSRESMWLTFLRTTFQYKLRKSITVEKKELHVKTIYIMHILTSAKIVNNIKKTGPSLSVSVGMDKIKSVITIVRTASVGLYVTFRPNRRNNKRRDRK